MTDTTAGAPRAIPTASPRDRLVADLKVVIADAEELLKMTAGQAGEKSAWHRVRSDEVWHLLEGGPLRLWWLPPDLSRVEHVDLGVAPPRFVIPADAWQAAEPLGDFAYVGATVGPGFDFADFAFGRDDAALRAVVAGDDSLVRLLGT